MELQCIYAQRSELIPRGNKRRTLAIRNKDGSSFPLGRRRNTLDRLRDSSCSFYPDSRIPSFYSCSTLPTLRTHEPGGSLRDYFERPESIEARAIMRLVSLGTTTLDGARDLIGIPERQEQALRMFVAIAGKDGVSIGYAVSFRRRVMIEFEKLVAVGQPELSTAA